VTRTTYSAAHVDRVVDHALHHAGVVAQVDEGELLAVLAAGGHPAGEADGLADVLGTELAARCVRMAVLLMTGSTGLS
jgi:hypothetical protein